MKDSVICFWISKDLRRVPEKISALDRRSLSGTIDNILYSSTERRGAKVVKEEKLQIPGETELVVQLPHFVATQTRN